MIGKTIIHYKITEELGRGGMGVVYKAEDTKLKRLVAIKFLPREIVASNDERERFKIEAQAAAALNHPNIATIHAIEEIDGEMFIVMEFIDGKELREIINIPLNPPSKGDFSDSPFEGGQGDVLLIDTILAYATQIAAGLQAAHAKGIIHRDIKSSNIMITESVQVKIMDFGLAKIAGGAQLTKDHSTLGTAAYMSPEQARGEPVDHRTDIWSFGVVLYEMLTGQLPFRGVYEQAMIYSILNEAPQPVSELRQDVPIELEAIATKALAKKADERYQSAADLLSDLQQRTDTTANKATMFASKVQGRSKTGFLALGAIGLAAIIALFIYLQTDGEPKPIRLTNPRKITQAIGLENYPTWSPDGSKIAYASNQSGKMDIWIKQLSGGEPVNMTKDVAMECWWPSWSPDGSQIAFVARQDGGSIWVMPAIGGPARRVGACSPWATPVWSPDGEQLACVVKDSTGLPMAEIYTLSSYEKSEVILPGRHFDRYYLSWSPNGEYFAYSDADNLYEQADISAIKIVRIADGTDYQIANTGSLDFFPIWSLDGRRLYFLSDRGGIPDLWQVKLSADGSPEGEAEQISFGLGLQSLAFSPDQTKIAFSKEQRPQNLWRIAIPQAGAPAVNWSDVKQLTFESSTISSLDLAPEGKQVYFASNRSGNWDIWSMPATGGELRQLTTAPENDDYIHLSPDGGTLAFVSARSGRLEIWTMPASGGPAKQITNHPNPKFWPRWSPDGQTIAFNASDSASNLDFWVVPAQGGEALQLTNVKKVYYPLWWPDGQSLVSAGTVGHWGLWRFPIAGGEPEPLTGAEFNGIANDLRWSSDKTQIYFIGGRDIWSLSVVDGAVRQLTDFNDRYGRLGRDLATDGAYLYFKWREHTGDIWVMDVEREY